MPEARVELEGLKSFKTALVKFAEAANVAIGDAESEVIGTLNWLENEQTVHWQNQVRKRSDLVGRCQEAVRMKRLFKDSSGRQQSAVEEEKALRTAQRQLEEAQEKVALVRKAIRWMEREIPLYKGTVQRFATDVTVTVPAATAHLETLLVALEAYAGLGAPAEATSAAPSVSSSAPAGIEPAGSMARAVDEDEKKPATDDKTQDAPSAGS